MESYTIKDLVSFGNYLLSDERRELYANHPHFGDKLLEIRLSAVSEEDIDNWKTKYKS